MRIAPGFLMVGLALAGCSSEAGISASAGDASTGAASGSAGIEIGEVGSDPRPSDGLGPLGTCVTATTVAEARPSTVQMVVDTSGSMQWPPGWSPDVSANPPPDAPSKWEITKRALDDAVAALPSDTALGVSFYPNLAHTGTSCIKNEVALPIARLGDARSTQREHFQRALADVEPQGGTPTHAAYRFGSEKLLASGRPGNRFLLLITDGTPTHTLSCSGDGRSAVDSGALVAEAAARRSEHGVLTFVIGSPGSDGARSALSRLAAAGGTASARCSEDGPAYCHFDMTEQRDLGAALGEAFASISKRMATCEYPIPAVPAGQVLDPSQVNVVYTEATGPAEIIGRDASGTCEDGWQYADDGAHIVLCGQSCERVKQGASAKVELYFGCATTQTPPR